MINYMVSNAWMIFGLALSLLVLCIVPIIIEIWKTMRDIRLIADRVEMLTDIRGWLDFFKRFQRKSRKEKKDY
ncbi:MAG: hypothetical protein ABIH39_01465 [Candidatus Margulisiibacteriota bacterium]